MQYVIVLRVLRILAGTAIHGYCNTWIPRYCTYHRIAHTQKKAVLRLYPWIRMYPCGARIAVILGCTPPLAPVQAVVHCLFSSRESELFRLSSLRAPLQSAPCNLSSTCQAGLLARVRRLSFALVWVVSPLQAVVRCKLWFFVRSWASHLAGFGAFVVTRARTPCHRLRAALDSLHRWGGALHLRAYAISETA